MTGTYDLGRLEKIEDLRSIWSTEAKDFTPWLAQERNLGLLGDTIGLDLELDSTEKGVGPFRADIVCKETSSDHWVLVENQIEKTDHIHLGQLLTYAAGLNAVTIVWIAKQFSDEHRAALDWLNEFTVDGISFFGLEVELWRIGDSPIAPKFNMVSTPNEWTKGGGGVKPRTGLTDTQQRQLDFWTEFREYVMENAKRIKPAKPQPAHWLTFSVGRSHFGADALVDIGKQRIAIRMFVAGPNATAHYNLLLAEKEQIEEEFGESLEWEELPHRKSSYISLYKTGENPKDKKQRARQKEWLLTRLEKYHEVFSGRIKKLDAGDWVPDEVDD